MSSDVKTINDPEQKQQHALGFLKACSGFKD
jgi:hypothetical protein